jgi:predicted CXXCH cytochrome family protein
MRRLLVAAIFFAAPIFAASDKQAVIGSQHDLGRTGSGPVKSAVSDSCMFCHAPHNIPGGAAPLWDHQLSSQIYTTYFSSTYNSGPQTPSAGSSKLCLSCHDGTVAVGLTVSHGSIPTSGAMAASDVLGPNLSSGHPVSMTPVDDGQLVPSLFGSPASTKDAAVRLVAGRVECTTCHDPHVPNNDSVVRMFLSRSNSNGTLCLACHDPTRAQPNALGGWTTGSHATATNGVGASVEVGAYGTVAANACSSCHGAHQNPAGARNLKAAEEAACSPCHGGTNVAPALLNVTAEFTKTYRHPTDTVSGAHDAAEPLPVNAARHAECPDCHNSHAASAQLGVALAPFIQASLAGVSGYDDAGAQKSATREYQVCFKCHADSTNKVQNSTYAAYGRTASRYPQGPMPAGYPIPPPLPTDQYNIRLQFTGTIGHNVMGSSIVTTSNTTLRSFMLNVDGTNNTSRPLTTASQLYCTDCHNNDQARSFRGTGPNGPHGSSIQHLLQLNLYLEPAGGGSGNTTTGYALCNKCHNLSNLNNIRPHDPHMRFGCTTCHDPHGVIGGSAASNRAMMNFDTAIVTKATTYFGYFYIGPGNNQKGCYLRCHGENHNPFYY